MSAPDRGCLAGRNILVGIIRFQQLQRCDNLVGRRLNPFAHQKNPVRFEQARVNAKDTRAPSRFMTLGTRTSSSEKFDIVLVLAPANLITE